MATASQVQNFADTYGTYAQQAGSELGVSPLTLLAQWGYETNYGTQEAGTNNLGNIMSNGTAVNYSSPSSFVQAFVNLIQKDYPNAENTGANGLAYVAALQNGTDGSYYGTQSEGSYAQGEEGAATTIMMDAQGIVSSLFGNSTNSANTASSSGTSQTATSTGTSNGTTDPCSGISAVFTFSCWQPILGNVLLIGLGLLLMLGAILVLSETHLIPQLQTVSKIKRASKRAFT